MREETKLAERRERILELLKTENKVRVSELSRLFAASEVTIRNDLAELERRGLLERLRGGAVPVKRSYYNMSFAERSRENVGQKRRIAAHVATLIQDQETLSINAGTTTLLFAEALAGKKGLRVLTNSLPVVQALGEAEDNRCTLLGGSVNARYQFTYGPEAVEQIRRYRADRLILSVDGVSTEGGITTYHAEETELDRMMMERANQVIVVADHSKIGRESFAAIAALQRVDLLVTSQGAPDQALERIRETGVQVMVI